MQSSTMRGAFLPGDSTVEMRECPVPTPGYGQMLIRTGASGICGSDIKFIYRGYLSARGFFGSPVYKGVICGHEPSGTVVDIGPGVKQFGIDDRILVYHIQGCGHCTNCRAGYFIQCSNHSEHRAYGWQRDGANADYVLVDESTAIALPDELSFVDGSLISCGFGTAWEGVSRAAVCGADDLLVVGLGPVGLATAMIGRLLGARRVIGVEQAMERIEFSRTTGLFDDVVAAGDEAVSEVFELTHGAGCNVTVDCSGSLPGRSVALNCVAEWGRVSLLGEGGDMHTEVSDILLHKQVTIHASWVTSVHGMEKVTRLLAESGQHPETIVSHRFGLSDADKAYALAAAGVAGKVVVIPSTG